MDGGYVWVGVDGFVSLLETAHPFCSSFREELLSPLVAGPARATSGREGRPFLPDLFAFVSSELRGHMGRRASTLLIPHE